MKTLNIHSKIIYWLALISLFGIGANMPISNRNQTDRIVFAMIGDYGSAGQPEADVANLVKSWSPDFIVSVGDNNYPNGALYSIDKNIGQYYHDYIYKYKGKYGKGSDTRRFFPALGNHDWHNNSINPYINYFNLPGNERYYDFTYGPVHFFILDSIKNERDGNSAASAQAKWLQKKMAASTSQFNIVVTHYAPYSSGEHGAVPFMQWPFKEWGADAVIAGHDHDYERLLVNDLPYFVNGLGGDELAQFRSNILPESQIRYNENYGAMRVEATSTFMKFQFYSRDNILIDEYTLGDDTLNVTTIQRADSNPTHIASVTYRVNFSESVTGVDISDFSLAANSINDAVINNITGSGAEYLVTVSTGTGNGTLRLDLVDDNSITNEAGELLGGENLGDGNFTGETYIISDEIPTSPFTPTLLTPANGATLSTRFIFTWIKISSATRYEIQIDNNSNFSSPEWNLLRSVPNYQVASMPRKTSYYWHVRAKDASGIWSEWSTVFKLNVP